MGFNLKLSRQYSLIISSLSDSSIIFALNKYVLDGIDRSRMAGKLNSGHSVVEHDDKLVLTTQL